MDYPMDGVYWRGGNQKGHGAKLEEVAHYGYSFVPDPSLLSLYLPPAYSEVSHCGPHVPRSVML